MKIPFFKGTLWTWGESVSKIQNLHVLFLKKCPETLINSKIK